MGRLRINVPGGVRVQHGEAALTFRTRKALALFVYLVVEGGLHSRDKLAALLWPDQDPPHARAMLRYTLAGMRHMLQDSADAPHILLDHGALGIDASSGIELDLDVLRTAQSLSRTGTLSELRQAVGSCRGEFLEAFCLPDTTSFDEWVSVQRESGLHSAELLFDRLSQLEFESADTYEAISTVERWLAISPLNEEAHRRLMRLHLARGDRSAALDAYEHCRALLQRELHVTPAAETQSLAEGIRATHDRVRPLRNVPGRAPPLGRFEGPLVGRTSEFIRLGELYKAVLRGDTQVVVVRGEPGIGKTRLVQDFLDWTTAQGADVVQGRAFETGGRLPYQPLVEFLRVRLERENAPEDLLSDVWLVELTRLLPELRERYPDLPVATADEGAARIRLFEAIARLGQELAQRAPLVLFVDDIQWADAGTLDALHYAAQRWADSHVSVLVLLSLRSEAVVLTPTLAEWLDGLPRAVTLTQVELGPLAFPDVLQLLEHLAIEAERQEIEGLAAWLYTETAGQPPVCHRNAPGAARARRAGAAAAR